MEGFLFWLILAVFALVGGAAMLNRRRTYESPEAEPWRASLDDDEPLDLEEIRRAEEEFLSDEGWSPEESGEEEEPWR
jgi:hypothetical protein